MTYATIRSVNLFHQVFGTSGPWLSLNAGGRHRGLEMAPLAELIAAEGFRVLIHDRRNTGASDMLFEGEGTEEEIWADDLHALMQHHGALPAFFGGSSAGARLSMMMQTRYPQSVKGLLLMRVTGGEFAAGRLPNTYYGQFIQAAKEGGMQAVCNTAPYAERLHWNPGNRDKLMAMKPEDYIAIMQRWLDSFLQGPISPVMGMPEAQLRAFDVPTLVVPGNDKTHASVNGYDAAAVIPGAELFELPITDQDVDLIPFPQWHEHFAALAKKFASFMRQHATR